MAKCDMCGKRGTLYRRRGLYLCKEDLETMEEIEDEEE
jgi:hypothetical protein